VCNKVIRCIHVNRMCIFRQKVLMLFMDRKDMSIFTLRFTKILCFCFGTPVMMYVCVPTCDTPVQLLTCTEDIN